LQLELQLTNDERVLPSVRAFARETLRQLPLTQADAANLEKLVVGAVADAVAHAYRPGEEGAIKLSINDTHGRLEILVRDFGLPQDVVELERRLHETAESPDRLFGCPFAAIDEVHWLAFGPEGKALQVRKWLHDKSIIEHTEAANLTPFVEGAPLAPQQQYTVRRMQPGEAVQVSQLMYRTYGGTYFNPDVYYPERVAAHNANGTVISFVAVAEDGYVAGHTALEMNQSGQVAESGQAAVDPAHRGRGLLERMKELSLEVATQRNLSGWYADAVAVHELTQKSNVNHGGKLTAVDLAISPRTEKFRGFGEQKQRVTCLMYFHWLKRPEARRVCVPARHREMVAAIYRRLGCPVTFVEDVVPSGHGTLAVKADPGAGTAFIRADQLGEDTVHAIRHAKRELIERSHVETVFVELPVEDPGAAHIAEELSTFGFGFAGIAPHFSMRGDLLRLVYLVEALEREPIKTYDADAAHLVDYVLAEQDSVRAGL
jgi:anti-sigma regulatory factor (Ser/Thr protein kinase)/GNAT superfamily N-acetyltransferase